MIDSKKLYCAIKPIAKSTVHRVLSGNSELSLFKQSINIQTEKANEATASKAIKEINRNGTATNIIPIRLFIVTKAYFNILFYHSVSILQIPDSMITEKYSIDI
jgi:hypothetical protein